MRFPLVAAVFFLTGFCVELAYAGAWTLDRGQVQVITGVTVSTASRRFDAAGRPSQNVVFEKLFGQYCIEYGLTNAVTLYVAPEIVTARSGSQGAVTIQARS